MKPITRHKILLAAAECFAHKGFNAASIGDIARAAGISQGAMYNHFDGKNALIVAIVHDETEAALAAYRAPFNGSSFEHLCTLINNCVTKSGYPIEPHLWIEIIAEASRNPDVNKAFIEADLAMRGALKAIVIRGLERREFRNIDPEETSIVLFALLDGLLARRAYAADFVLQKHLASLKDVVARVLGVTTE